MYAFLLGGIELDDCMLPNRLFDCALRTGSDGDDEGVMDESKEAMHVNSDGRSGASGARYKFHSLALYSILG